MDISNSHPQDAKLAGILKALLKNGVTGPQREKLGRQVAMFRGSVRDPALGTMLDGLFGHFPSPPAAPRPPTVDDACGFLGGLRDNGFLLSASVLFRAWTEIIAGLGLDKVVVLAPDSGSLELWRKASKSSAKDVVQQLLVDPSATFATVGADWLLEHAKAIQAFPVIVLLLGRQSRPRYLRSWQKSLAEALSKDIRGELVLAILCHAWPTPEPLAALTDVLLSEDRALMKMVIDLLPAIMARKEGGESVPILVERLCQTAMEADATARETATAAMARLGSGIVLTDRPGPQAEAVAAMLRKNTTQLRSVTRDDNLKSRTWVLDNLGDVTVAPDNGIHVTLAGARSLAVAFEKADQGFGARDILTVTARNLGLSAVGTKGAEVSYDPLRHEDIDGGLLPKDIAWVSVVGWARGEDVIVRCKVKKGKADV